MEKERIEEGKEKKVKKNDAKEKCKTIKKPLKREKEVKKYYKKKMDSALQCT